MPGICATFRGARCAGRGDYHTLRIHTERKLLNHIAQLTAMGYRVTLEPAA
jgi:transposase